MNASGKRMLELLSPIHAYDHAQTILRYDSVTSMPRQGAAQLAQTSGYLAGESYRLRIAPAFREALEAVLADSSEEEYLRREATEQLYELNKLSVFSQEEYASFQQTQGLARRAWRDAKESRDFRIFAPYLKQLTDHAREAAQRLDSRRPVYDVLLADWNQEADMALLDPFFARIKEELLPLIAEVSARPVPRRDFLQRHYPAHEQAALAEYLRTLMGVDRGRCGIGQTEHPFTTGPNSHDIRIAVHYHEDDMAASLFGVLHESGHSLYMTNVDDLYGALLLADGASKGIHESQSGFFENQLGHSRAFLAFLYPELRRRYPQQLQDVTAEDIYLAVNACHPSPVRLGSDELTYPLHIIIAYEIEKALFAGELTVDGLPSAWNELYQKYLGVTPADDSQGALQGSHWSDSLFGYFPSYVMGLSYACQFLAAMEREFPLWEQVAAGDLTEICAWLKQKIWRWGWVKTPRQLLSEATGEDFGPERYLTYLKHKYTELYSL